MELQINKHLLILPSGPHDEQLLPPLPPDVLRQILGVVTQQWCARPAMLAREEVRQWTCFSLVCKEWQAAFQNLSVCVVFDEVRRLYGLPYPFTLAAVAAMLGTPIRSCEAASSEVASLVCPSVFQLI